MPSTRRAICAPTSPKSPSGWAATSTTSRRCCGVLQGFDPVGVGARDLAECLALQLKAQGPLDPAMAALLTRLDLVARRDMAALSAALRRRCRRHRRHDRGNPRPHAQAGPGLRHRAGAAGGARRVRARRAGRRLARSNSTPTRCRGFWSMRATTRRSQKAPATRMPRTI